MSSSFQQAQSEGLCLRYPDNLGLHREVTYDMAVNMLLRAISMSQNVPYTWGFVDKPLEGQALLLFLPPQSMFPIDGIRFQDQEVKYSVPIGTARELEVHEVKYGFIPGAQETNAWRVRRRYRLAKGGHPQLVLVHYGRGPSSQIVPSLMNQPLRPYPLRIINEPAVYVIGDKVGQKVYPQGTPVPSAPPMPLAQPGMAMGMNFNQQQAMVAQQNSNMEQLERRRERERVERERARERSGSTSGRPTRPEDDDSGDENDQISTRTLALTRYRRNHDIMNEVFKHAAYGEKNTPPPPSPYSIFNKSELEESSAKLRAEIEALQGRKADRETARRRAEQITAEHQAAFATADVSMDVLGGGIIA